MKKLADKDLFMGEVTEEDADLYGSIEREYIDHVFTALKDAGAVDLKGIGGANLERMTEELLSKIDIDSNDPVDIFRSFYPIAAIESLRIKRLTDSAALGFNYFQTAAHTEI